METSSSDWQLLMESFPQRAQYLLTSEEWADCSFLVGSVEEKKEIRAHKVILAMSSPVFARMFYGLMAENKFPISVEDIHQEDFESLLQYLYTGNTKLDSLEDTMNVCYAAKKYMVPGLVKLCVDKCWNYLSPKTACNIYEFAQFLDEEKLAKQCLKVISVDTMEVLGDPSFYNIKTSTLETILEMDELTIPSEMELFNALCSWTQYKNQQRGDTTTLRSLMSTRLFNLRFLTLTPQDIIERVAKTHLLTDLETYAIVSNMICPNSTEVSMPPNFSTNRTKRSANHLVSLTTDKYSWIQNMKTTEEFDGNLFITSVIFEVSKKMKIVGVQVAKRMNSSFHIKAGEANAVISIDIAIDGGKPISNFYLKEMKTWENATFETNFGESVYLERNNVYVLKTILHHPRLKQLLVPSHGVSQQGAQRVNRACSSPQYYSVSATTTAVTSVTRSFVFANSFGIALPHLPQTEPSTSEQPHFVFQEQDNIKLKMFV